mmetsp:Transcript_49982/g.143881  ORF Transcript_49982/g.143881 Transcript_49982/m.143881 type:complete len:260 (-) Transcript_49982:1004-1783(-)
MTLCDRQERVIRPDLHEHRLLEMFLVAMVVMMMPVAQPPGALLRRRRRLGQRRHLRPALGEGSGRLGFGVGLGVDEVLLLLRRVRGDQWRRHELHVRRRRRRCHDSRSGRGRRSRGRRWRRRWRQRLRCSGSSVRRVVLLGVASASVRMAATLIERHRVRRQRRRARRIGRAQATEVHRRLAAVLAVAVADISVGQLDGGGRLLHLLAVRHRKLELLRIPDRGGQVPRDLLRIRLAEMLSLLLVIEGQASGADEHLEFV